MQPEQPKENPVSQPTTYTNPVDGGQEFSPAPQPPTTSPSPVPVSPLANNVLSGSALSGTVKTYKTAAILVAVFCSLPLGIIALVYSNNAEKSLKAGDLEEAQKASKTARIWVIVGVVIGLPFSILYVIGRFHSA